MHRALRRDHMNQVITKLTRDRRSRRQAKLARLEDTVQAMARAAPTPLSDLLSTTSALVFIPVENQGGEAAELRYREEILFARGNSLLYRLMLDEFEK